MFPGSGIPEVCVVESVISTVNLQIVQSWYMKFFENFIIEMEYIFGTNYVSFVLTSDNFTQTNYYY